MCFLFFVYCFVMICDTTLFNVTWLLNTFYHKIESSKKVFNFCKQPNMLTTTITGKKRTIDDIDRDVIMVDSDQTLLPPEEVLTLDEFRELTLLMENLSIDDVKTIETYMSDLKI